MDAEIRLLVPEDTERYVALRHVMLADVPMAFGASPEDDIGTQPDKVRGILVAGSGNVIFGAFAPQLVGAAGLVRARHRKAAHIATVWGMYVASTHRRRGLGRRLLAAVVDHARSLEGIRQVHLGVSDTTPGARALYEEAGFRRWGTEPRATLHDGRFADEHHMCLPLDEGRGQG